MSEAIKQIELPDDLFAGLAVVSLHAMAAARGCSVRTVQNDISRGIHSPPQAIAIRCVGWSVEAAKRDLRELPERIAAFKSGRLDQLSAAGVVQAVRDGAHIPEQINDPTANNYNQE